MNSPHSILIAFAHDGLRSALEVVEALEPIADVQLCPYEQVHQRAIQDLDVALCVVTDEESLDLAHKFQVHLEDIPTIVIDGAGDLKIEVNGYAERISSAPDQVIKAVRQLLVPDRRRESPTTPKAESTRSPRRIASPFDHTLARNAGGEQSSEALLIAASRQLSWDLRAERVEVFLRLAEKNVFKRIYAEPKPSAGRDSMPSGEIVRLIKKRSYPVSLRELGSRSTLPLYEYLAARNLNLLVPLAKESRLLGWLAFSLDATRETDDLLDDLQVAGQLLSISLAEAFDREAKHHEAKSFYDALSALNFGILTVDRDGEILNVSGATSLLGSDPRKGDHFKAIHNSRVREVVAAALKGNFLDRSWIDLASRELISSFSTRLPDGRIVVFWGPRQDQQEPARTSANLELKEVIESLPVPVLLDNEVSPGTVPVPHGRISDEDGRAIRDCALRAQARNVKALRLRWGKQQSPENAVLFYDSNVTEGCHEFCDDIKHAVRFSLLAA